MAVVAGRAVDVVATVARLRATRPRGPFAARSPVMPGADPAATVTASNAGAQSDGAAPCVVAMRADPDDLGRRQTGRRVGSAVAGMARRTVDIGRVPAFEPALPRAEPSFADIDLIEPVGATGTGMRARLLHDRRGARYGLEAVCTGGGQGPVAGFEVQ